MSRYLNIRTPEIASKCAVALLSLYTVYSFCTNGFSMYVTLCSFERITNFVLRKGKEVMYFWLESQLLIELQRIKYISSFLACRFHDFRFFIWSSAGDFSMRSPVN